VAVVKGTVGTVVGAATVEAAKAGVTAEMTGAVAEAAAATEGV
jgi:hypothetical protein